VRYAAWYGIVVGLLIVLQRALFLITGAVPELQSAPLSIGFHMAAEWILALALIAGGVALLRARRWGGRVLMVVLGMAIYSEINSPGYFAQQGTWALVGMFAVLLAGALVGVYRLKLDFKE
jgi:hypothetical protein